MFLLTLLGCSFDKLNIYGEVKRITVKDHWGYFGFTYGDFGHTVSVHAYVQNDDKTKFTPTDVTYSYGFNCPTNLTNVLKDKSFFFDNPSQSVIMGIYVNTTEDREAIVEVISNVRPIHPNSSMSLIFSFFLFFCFNFVLAGFLQFHYFKQSMDPREYLPQEE